MAQYIPKCLDSVINQTYSNLEIIIVDDGSTDNTEAICREYEKKDSRIRYIKHPRNMGQANARSTGLEHATGDYISFIDSDDYIALDYYEVLYNNLKENDADISICNYTYITEGETYAHDETFNKVTVYEGDERFYMLQAELIVQFMASWCKIIKKEIFGDLRYLPNSSNEDANLSHKIIGNAGRIVYTDRVGYFYVRRQGSIVNSKFKVERIDFFDGELERLILYKDVIKNKKLYEAELITFWLMIVEDLYCLENYIENSEGIRKNLIEKYEGVQEVLEATDKLQSGRAVYDEDFGRFVDLEIPLEYVYLKMVGLKNRLDMELVKEDVWVMKVYYTIAEPGGIVTLMRMLFGKDITSSRGKKGLEITLKSSIKDRNVIVGVADNIGSQWVKMVQLNDSDYTTIQIPFNDFQIGRIIEMIPTNTIDASRIKTVQLSLIGTSKDDCGCLYVKNIKFY